MGFYDVRCGLSGLSLKGQRAALVLIAQQGEEWEPIWVPLQGPYNRLGAIDVKADVAPHAAHLTKAFQQLHAEGRLEHRGDPFDDGDFFEHVEPNRNFNAIDGRRVSLALFHHRMLDGVTDECPDDESDRLRGMDLAALFAEALPHAAASFDPELPNVRRARELFDLQAWGKKTGWKFAPPESYGQHTDADIQQYHEKAKTRLAGHSFMLQALELASYEL